MVRAGTGPLDTHLVAYATSAKGPEEPVVEIKFRKDTTGGQIKVVRSMPVKAPFWVKVERLGKVLIGSYSTDGKMWHEVNRQEIDVGAKPVAGLVAWNRYQAGTVAFEEVTVGK